MPDTDTDAACAVAHGATTTDDQDTSPPTLVAVFASPVAEHLLHYGEDLGFRPVLLEPDHNRANRAAVPGTTIVGTTALGALLDTDTDVIVTDHHRPELGAMLRDVLSHKTRWIGLMGNPRHRGPHIDALTELGVPADDIARVHRPIGLNIGSRTPPEIAIAALAGLVADRNNRPGGFQF